MDALIPFTTSGSLVDCVDKKVVVVMRDGRKFIGVLRSYDQFANFLLEGTIERIHHQNLFGDQQVGVMLIRGENVVMLGEIDLDTEDEVPLHPIPFHEIKALREADLKRRHKSEVAKAKALKSLGFAAEGQEGDAY